MSTAPMHCDAQGAAQSRQRACDGCGTLFTPKRSWQRFHSDECRNAFHAAEARKAAIREAAQEMFEALLAARAAMRGTDLEHIWINYPEEPALELGTKIDRALAKAGHKP